MADRRPVDTLAAIVRCNAMILGLCTAWSAGCVAQPQFQGPLPVRNQHPAQLTVLHMLPASAAALPAGSVAVRADAAYSSLFVYGAGGRDDWFMDGEYLRAAARASVGLGAALELGAELAFAHTTGGFLDGFLIDYHDLIGVPDQDRKSFPEDQWQVEARRNGQTVWSVDRVSGELLDLPVELKWQIAPPGEQQLGVAVRGAVELPTGDADRGFGSGGIDYGLGALFDYRALGVAWYGHVQQSWPATPASLRQAGLSLQPVTTLGVAAELPLADDLSALVQVTWETSALRQLGVEALQRDQVLLWVGGRYRPGPHWAIEVGFGEDLQTRASPDFTAWLAVVWLP